EVAQIDSGVVAGGAGADDHHAAVVADEDRGGDGALAGVLEDDARIAPLTQHLPERLAEGARSRRPPGERGVVTPVWDHAPVVEALAIDEALGAQLDAVLAAF